MSLGLAAAAEVDLVAYLVSRYFGMKAYGKVYGWQLSAFYLGASIGPALMGFSYDYFQSYQYNLYTSVVIFVLGAAAVGSLGKRPVFSS
jgi:MFS family permease